MEAVRERKKSKSKRKVHGTNSKHRTDETHDIEQTSSNSDDWKHIEPDVASSLMADPTNIPMPNSPSLNTINSIISNINLAKNHSHSEISLDYEVMSPLDVSNYRVILLSKFIFC